MSRTYRRHVGEHQGFRCYPHKTGRTGDRHIQKNWGPRTRVAGDRVVFGLYDEGVCHSYEKRRTARQRRRLAKLEIRRQLRELGV